MLMNEFKGPSCFLGAYRYLLQTCRNWYRAVPANRQQLQKTHAAVHYRPRLSHKMLIELRKLSEGHRIVEPVSHVEVGNKGIYLAKPEQLHSFDYYCMYRHIGPAPDGIDR